MNLDVDEKVGLIDFSTEDDFLIDKCFDTSSLDLRLSVAFETQMELVCDLKPRTRVGMDDRIQYLADRELETYQMEREHGNNGRNSLAWDNAFFTSPGFLELEELCLVNRGFKDPQRQSVCGISGNVRRKVCLERNSGYNKAGIAAGRRQSRLPLTRAKLASPTKMRQHQQITTRQSEAFIGAVSKSQVMQSTTSKKEFMKSSKAMGQNRFSTAQNKTSPLQGLDKNGKIKTPERLESVVSSSLPVVPTTATNTSIDLSPHTSKDYNQRTLNSTKSQEVIGECLSGSHSPFSVDCQITDACYNSSIAGHRNNQQLQQSCMQQLNSGAKLQRQNATRATKSPLYENSQLSPKPSNLRLPSEKIDYFDMHLKSQKSGVSTVNESSLLSPNAHVNCDEEPVRNASTYVHTPTNEPKNRLNDLKPKRTPAILQERKAHTRNKADVYREHLDVSSHFEDGIKPSDKGQKRRNYPNIMKRTNAPGKEEKENMFIAEDTVIELKPKNHSPLPLQLSPNECSSMTHKPTISSRKRFIIGQNPTRQPNLSPIGIRKPFSTKNSPLQKSAIF